jgi:hypothetical protein
MTLNELYSRIQQERQELHHYQRELGKATKIKEIDKIIQHIKLHRKNIGVLQRQIDGRKRLEHVTNGY